MGAPPEPELKLGKVKLAYLCGVHDERPCPHMSPARQVLFSIYFFLKGRGLVAGPAATVLSLRLSQTIVEIVFAKSHASALSIQFEAAHHDLLVFCQPR
jgi:hypothetical protein